MRSTTYKSGKMVRHLRGSTGRLAAAAMCALLANSARAATGDFAVTQDVSSGAAINSLARADDLHAGGVSSSRSATGDFSVVNFKAPDESTLVHFGNTAAFPVAEPPHDHNFAMHITGEVAIPTAGEWSFGVKSNGGFVLQIGDKSMERKASSGGSTRIVPMHFAEAGTYSVDLTYYEDARRASLELFASEGKFHRFHARGADFELVGDSVDGGLSVAEALDPVADDPVVPSNITSPGQITPAAVPEPGGMVLAGVIAPWILTRRWRPVRS
jgi:hypothetical protein